MDILTIDVYKRQAQDCMPLDSVPYIGQFSSKTPHIYIATGFNKWGMTSSMVAARLISEMISTGDNDCLLYTSRCV